MCNNNMLRILLVVIFAVGLTMCLACGNAGFSNDASLQRGLADYENGKYESAIEHLKKVADQGTSEVPAARVQTIIGNCYNEVDQLDESIKWHKRSLQTDPKQHETWVNMGVAYRLLGEFDEAEKCYLEALRLNPDYPELHASLGALYVFKGDPDKAVEELELSLRLDNTLAVAHANLSLAYAMVNRFDDADRELKQAIVRGYQNGEVIRRRIDDLKAASN